MTMPTGPFPRVEDDPSLFAQTRGRARTRRTRRAALTAAVSVTAVALGAAALLGGQRAQEPDVPTAPPGGPTDSQLVGMTACTDDCQVASRVQLSGHRTFAVVGHFYPSYNPKGGPAQYEARAFVLARGTTPLDVLPAKGALPGFVHEVSTDSTGNVLVPLGDASDRLWFLPFSTTADHLTLLQGTQREPAILGHEGTGFADRNHDGRLEIVSFLPTTRCDTCADALSWSWNGTQYVSRQCAPEPLLALPSCGVVTTPALGEPARASQPTVQPSSSEQPSWYAQVGCATGCHVTQSVILASGHTLRILTDAQGGYRLVLVDGHALLGTLPPDRFTLDLAADLHVDRTGHALLEVLGNTAHWVVPIGERAGKPVVLQGGLETNMALYGDNNTEVKDVNGDGLLDVLVSTHKYATATEPYKQSTTTWQWNGTRYAPTGCTGALC